MLVLLLSHTPHNTVVLRKAKMVAQLRGKDHEINRLKEELAAANEVVKTQNAQCHKLKQQIQDAQAQAQQQATAQQVSVGVPFFFASSSQPFLFSV